MRPLKSLSLDQMLRELRNELAAIPDPRAAAAVRYGLPDTRMSGFAMMFFQPRSRLNFQRQMARAPPRGHRQTIFKVRAVPSDTQRRTILDGAPTDPLRSLWPRGLEKIRRARWAGQFQTGGPIQVETQVPYSMTEVFYTGAPDGRPYFHSTAIPCANGLPKTTAAGDVHYSHTVVAATRVKAGTHRILPLDVEAVRHSDGHEKQDGEINAGQRLIQRRRGEHRPLKMIITGDDL